MVKIAIISSHKTTYITGFNGETVSYSQAEAVEQIANFKKTGGYSCPRNFEYSIEPY